MLKILYIHCYSNNNVKTYFNINNVIIQQKTKHFLLCITIQKLMGNRKEMSARDPVKVCHNVN